MTIDLEGLLLVIGVLPIIVLVWLLVEGLKTYGLISSESWLTAPRAGLTAGILLGIIALSTELFPEYAGYVILAVRYVFAGIFAGLFYEIVGDPVLSFVQTLIGRIFGSGE